MKKNSKPYLDYYKKYNISPVLSKVNLKFHSNQRIFLYTKLGITSSSIKNRNVLEFGPGNGLNAIITNSFEPKKYFLVEANPKGIENCKKNLLKYSKTKNWKVINCNINNFSIKKKFDLVICECLLPEQIDPKKMANYCAKYTSKGGIFLLTCHDYVSTLSETLKCLPAWIMASKINNFKQQTNFLVKIFKKHLSFLKGMTRTPEDWVIDNVINTELWQDAPLFNIGEAIDALKRNFVVYKTFPNFVSDWRWYKITKDFKNTENLYIREKYIKNLHNFIDYRVTGSQQSLKRNNALQLKCKSVRFYVKKYFMNFDDNCLKKIILNCQNIKETLPDSHNLTKKSINEVILIIKAFLKTKKIKLNHFDKIAPWWGRGLQYVAFIKK